MILHLRWTYYRKQIIRSSLERKVQQAYPRRRQECAYDIAPRIAIVTRVSLDEPVKRFITALADTRRAARRQAVLTGSLDC